MVKKALCALQSNYLCMKMISFCFLGKRLNQTNLCKNAVEFNVANRKANRYLKSILSQNESNSTCLRPCTTISYSASLRKMSYNSKTLSSSKNTILDWVSFGLTYKDLEVTTNHEYYVMSTEALVSTIGGFLGLFLGFSCLSVINWILDNVKKYIK